LSRFLELLEAVERQKGLGSRSHAVVLEAVLKEIKTPRDAEAAVEIFEKITPKQVEQLAVKAEEIDLHAIHVKILLEDFFARFEGKPKRLSLDEFSFEQALKEIKATRKAIGAIRKTKAINSEVEKKLTDRLREQIVRVREVQNIERQAVVDLASSVREILEKRSTIKIEDLKRFLFDELGFGSCFSANMRERVETGLDSYVVRFQKIREFFHQYKHDPRALFDIATPQGVRRNAVKHPIKIHIRGISLIFELEGEDYEAAYPEMKQSAGLSFDESPILSLRGSIVLTRGGYDYRFQEEIEIHENRHQEDRFFFEFVTAAERAKTEIIAYITQGLRPTEIKKILTNKEGLYYFQDVQKEDTWKKHCERVLRAIDIAFKVDNLDLLATTPMNQWTKLDTTSKLVA
jgi:hypothetical protein